jgi:hypothetical protein
MITQDNYIKLFIKNISIKSNLINLASNLIPMVLNGYFNSIDFYIDFNMLFIFIKGLVIVIFN